MQGRIDIPGDLEPWRRNARMSLWEELRSRPGAPSPWRRSHARSAVPADFLCPNPKLAVILDDGGDEDARRVAIAKAKGWRVLRAHPTEVVGSLRRICDALRKAYGLGGERRGLQEPDIHFDVAARRPSLASLASAPI